MAKVVLPIDPFQLTQEFGVNAEAYKRFGLKGHNGWDIRTIYSDTPKGRRYILAPQDVTFLKQGNEGNDGFGLYFEVITRTSKTIWKHTFAHCHSIEGFTTKPQGDHMAISDSTGNSTASHLHWTVKRLNPDSSVRDYNNGYFGAVNPQEYINEVRADITNSPQPMPTIDTEMQKITQHDASLKTADDVLKKITFLNTEIGRKDGENGQLQRANSDAKNEIERLTSINTEQGKKIAKLEADCHAMADNKYGALGQQLQKICIELLAFPEVKEAIKQIR